MMFVKAIVTHKLKELQAQCRVLSSSCSCLCKVLPQKANQWCLPLDRGAQKTSDIKKTKIHILQIIKHAFSKAAPVNLALDCTKHS